MRNVELDRVARLAKALEMDWGVLLKGLQNVPGKINPQR
jgi:hypothetical protein